MKNNHVRILVMLFLVLFLAQTAEAVPAFARRYKYSCSTCHDPFPRLKDYGDEFAGNGFIEPEEEKERDYVTAGDDKLWLNRDFPLAMRFDAYALAETQGDVKFDLQTPFGVKLFSGGTLYKNIGYYLYFYLFERGEVAGLEDAYIHFDNVFKSGLDILVGQFQTCDPLMKRELRLTYEDYHAYKVKIGDSNINLAYDRGLAFAYGIDKTGTDIIATVTTGNGIPEAGADLRFDADPYKNFMVRIAQGIGDHISVGGFYYRGKEDKVVDEVLTPGLSNTVTYFGPDLVLSLGKFVLTGQYLHRVDSDPQFMDILSAVPVQTDAVVAELVFAPKYDRSNTYWTLLYNYIDSGWDDADYQTIAFSGTYLLSRNLRLLGEYIYDLEKSGHQFILGFTSAF
ncbi:MAG: hypothetical protein PHC77_05845 [Candidatus Marinimicrobia bacterium]|nr:hypothetical protein [Candidatus Neomarinimicrobiota bacterium]